MNKRNNSAVRPLEREPAAINAARRSVEARAVAGSAARAAMDPGGASSGDFLALQHAAGNRATNLLLARHGIQPKLIVGGVDDAFEREAERMARRVSGPAGTGPDAEPAPSTRLAPREDGLGSFAPGDGFEDGLRAARSGGAPLSDSARRLMEPAFGADFSRVRVHTNATSERLSRAINAEAFTHGADIHFGAGRYRPGSGSGMRLLAHELTHTIQQGAAPVRRTEATRISAADPRAGTAGQSVSRLASRVQRAVLAIDGPADSPDAKIITANCLTNLTTRKRVKVAEGRTVQNFAGDARGAVYGQAEVGDVLKGLAGGVKAGEVKPEEDLYVLGHGGGNRVAGLAPGALAGELADAFVALPEPQQFRGAIKVVACYSGSLVEDGKPIVDPDTKMPITKTYAESLAAGIGAKRTAKFNPTAAQGVAGIAWVDELTGEQTGLDVNEGDLALNPSERLYQDGAKFTGWKSALTEPDPARRRKLMDERLDEEHRLGGETKLPTRVTGKKAKRSFPVR